MDFGPREKRIVLSVVAASATRSASGLQCERLVPWVFPKQAVGDFEVGAHAHTLVEPSPPLPPHLFPPFLARLPFPPPPLSPYPYLSASKVPIPHQPYRLPPNAAKTFRSPYRSLTPSSTQSSPLSSPPSFHWFMDEGNVDHFINMIPLAHLYRAGRALRQYSLFLSSSETPSASPHR